MSKIRAIADEITRQLEKHRLEVGGTLLPFEPLPYPSDTEVNMTASEVESCFDNSRFLVKDGKPGFVYIRDHTFISVADIFNPAKCRRIHFTVCGTLIQKLDEDRLSSRFCWTEGTTDLYSVDCKDNRPRTVKLYPCRDCLRYIDYQNFKTAGDSKRGENMKQKIVKSFNAKEAMVLLGQQLNFFRKIRKGLKPASEPRGYVPGHNRISKEFRESKNFTCDKCGVNLSDKPFLTDMHHIDRDKSNNEIENLQCLCKLCHGTEHPHYKVSREDEKRIRESRRRQNVL